MSVRRELKRDSFLSGYNEYFLGGFFCLYKISAEVLGDIAMVVPVCSLLEKKPLNLSICLILESHKPKLSALDSFTQITEKSRQSQNVTQPSSGSLQLLPSLVAQRAGALQLLRGAGDLPVVKIGSSKAEIRSLPSAVKKIIC